MIKITCIYCVDDMHSVDLSSFENGELIYHCDSSEPEYKQLANVEKIIRREIKKNENLVMLTYSELLFNKIVIECLKRFDSTEFQAFYSSEKKLTRLPYSPTYGVEYIPSGLFHFADIVDEQIKIAINNQDNIRTTRDKQEKLIDRQETLYIVKQ